MASAARPTQEVIQARQQATAKRYEAQGEKLWLGSAFVVMTTIGLALLFSGTIPGVHENLVGLKVVLGAGIPLGTILFAIGGMKLYDSFRKNLLEKLTQDMHDHLLDAAAARKTLEDGYAPSVRWVEKRWWMTAKNSEKWEAVFEVIANAANDVNAQDGEGNTHLHRLMGYGVWRDYTPTVKMVQTLKSAGADFALTNREGNTPLMVLLQGEHCLTLGGDLPSALIDKSTINHKNSKGYTPLNLALANSYSAEQRAFVEELLEQGATVTTWDIENAPIELKPLLIRTAREQGLDLTSLANKRVAAIRLGATRAVANDPLLNALRAEGIEAN